MSSETRVRASAATVASMVPHMLHYHPTEEQVVVLGLKGRRILGAAGMRWAGDPRIDVDTAANIARSFSHSNATGYVVLGYGPDGGNRARELASYLDAHPASLASTLSLMHVNEDSYRVAEGDAWSRAEPLERDDAEFILRGSNPASDRDERIDEFEPYAEPRWEAEPHYSVGHLSPAAQAARGGELLDAMRDPVPPVSPGQMSELNAIIVSSVQVRDAIIAHAVSRPDGPQALIELYRGAPASEQPHLAACASAAVFTGAEDGLAARALADRVQPTDRGGSLAQIMRECVESGIPPHVLHQDLVESAAQGLADHEAKWQGLRQALHRELPEPTPVERAQLGMLPPTAAPTRPSVAPRHRLEPPTSETGLER